MRIPIAHLMRYGGCIGTVFYNTQTRRCEDDNAVMERVLPKQDLLTCDVDRSDYGTVVGMDSVNGNYIVSFGTKDLYSVTGAALSDYKLTNMGQNANGTLTSADGPLEDLSDLFPDKKIQFQRIYTEEEKSSIGAARKFLADYDGRLCMVKFSKGSGLDLKNEKTYYDLSGILNFNCCEVKLSVYNGESCCLSFYEYDMTSDIFIAFKNTGLTVPELYERLLPEDKLRFDAMLTADFILQQQDRHMSNFALVNSRLYPLFDNGECLGIGAVGHFSEGYRNYVKRLEKDRLKQITAAWQKAKLSDAEYYDRDKCLGIINANMQELGVF